MKKNITPLIALTTFCLLSSAGSNAQVYATSVTSSQNVIHPQRAVDADESNYAVLRAPIGVLNFSEISLAFSQYGNAQMNGIVAIQTDGDILTADILQTLTLTLYDSDGNEIGEKSGIDFANANVGDGISMVNLHVGAKSQAKNIATIKIRLAGLASALNSIRLYYASLSSAGCPNVAGDIIHGSHNVQNAENAISSNTDDYALLTPPLLSGSAWLDIKFSDAGQSGKFVNFTLGEGNVVLNAALLNRISMSVYDTDDQLVVSKSDFALTDAEVLSNGMFKLKVKTPEGNYEVGRARITFTSLASLASTLRVYKTSHAPDKNPQQPHTSANGPLSFCKGDSVKLHARLFAEDGSTTYQWYSNGKEIDNATDRIYTAKKPGEYSVVSLQNGCMSNPSVAMIVTVNDCADDKISTIKINTYPNPFSTYTTINVTGNVKGATHIVISDKAGNLVEEYQLSATSSTRVLAKAAPGIYFIKVIYGNSVSTKTVVKL